MMVSRESPAYIKGQDGWCSGMNVSDNPYNRYSEPVAYSFWREGWYDMNDYVHSHGKAGFYYGVRRLQIVQN